MAKLSEKPDKKVPKPKKMKLHLQPPAGILFVLAIFLQSQYNIFPGWGESPIPGAIGIAWTVGSFIFSVITLYLWLLVGRMTYYIAAKRRDIEVRDG